MANIRTVFAIAHMTRYSPVYSRTIDEVLEISPRTRWRAISDLRLIGIPIDYTNHSFSNGNMIAWSDPLRGQLATAIKPITRTGELLQGLAEIVNKGQCRLENWPDSWKPYYQTATIYDRIKTLNELGIPPYGGGDFVKVELEWDRIKCLEDLGWK